MCKTAFIILLRPPKILHFIQSSLFCVVKFAICFRRKQNVSLEGAEPIDVNFLAVGYPFALGLCY